MLAQLDVRCLEYVLTRACSKLLTLLKFNIHLPLELRDYVIHLKAHSAPFHFCLLVKPDKFLAIHSQPWQERSKMTVCSTYLNDLNRVNPIQWATSNCDRMDTTNQKLTKSNESIIWTTSVKTRGIARSDDSGIEFLTS